MAKNQNPLLAQIEAQYRAKYKQRLDANTEYDYIAFVKTVNEELGVGPGRAGPVFEAFLANKKELLEEINKDYGTDKDSGDKQMLHTKSTYAKLMRRIFSREDWLRVRVKFQFLREFWED